VKASVKKIRLRIHSQIPRVRIGRRYLLECARQALRHFRMPVSSIDFILVTARKMAQMHRDYLHMDGSTDVMAFRLSETGAPLEGEVYICLDQAQLQSADYGVSLSSEVARLAVHGMLHLAGQNDRTNTGRARMTRLENIALKKAAGAS
jgi:rRNA maturation RNase YbeY